MLRLLLAVMLAATLTSAEPAPGDAALARRVEAALAPFHLAKRPPGANDWLAQHREAGQTLAEYMAARPRPAAVRRTTIYLRPLGAVEGDQPALLDAVQAALAAYFPVLVKRSPPHPLATIPDRAQRQGGQGAQLLSTWLLEVLASDRPADAHAVLGLTATDLWPGEGWNYVFGQASLVERVGVWSTARFGPAGDPLRLRRTVHTAVHETGHQFGLRHCIRWECLMNGSNHLAESDASPPWMCHECEAKVAWSLGGDPVLRLRRLAAFAKSSGFADAETMWTREAMSLE